jgi:hypothetical protein
MASFGWPERCHPDEPSGRNDCVSVAWHESILSGSPGAGKELARRADWQVDRAFLVDVLLISTAQKFLGAVRHEQLPPKFSSNTHLSK